VLDEQRDEREPVDPAGLGDGAFARRLRLQLMREPLDREDDGLLDPDEAAAAVRASAAALQAWHDGHQGGYAPTSTGPEVRRTKRTPSLPRPTA
jgi:hypothetical protein